MYIPDWEKNKEMEKEKKVEGKLSVHTDRDTFC
jgi:hypothetical protein